jgi:hypothetical protein
MLASVVSLSHTILILSFSVNRTFLWWIAKAPRDMLEQRGYFLLLWVCGLIDDCWWFLWCGRPYSRVCAWLDGLTHYFSFIIFLISWKSSNEYICQSIWTRSCWYYNEQFLKFGRKATKLWHVYDYVLCPSSFKNDQNRLFYQNPLTWGNYNIADWLTRYGSWDELQVDHLCVLKLVKKNFYKVAWKRILSEAMRSDIKMDPWLYCIFLLL